VLCAAYRKIAARLHVVILSEAKDLYICLERWNAKVLRFAQDDSWDLWRGLVEYDT
jgi:hypothetical protein